MLSFDTSPEPTALVEHLWSEEELQAGWESFQAALVVWRNEKGYDPRASQKLTKETKELEAPVLVA